MKDFYVKDIIHSPARAILYVQYARFFSFKEMLGSCAFEAKWHKFFKSRFPPALVSVVVRRRAGVRSGGNSGVDVPMSKVPLIFFAFKIYLCALFASCILLLFWVSSFCGYLGRRFVCF